MSKRAIEVRPSAYQPTKAEIDEQFKINASPTQLAKALLRDVEVRKAPLVKSRARKRG